MRETTYTTDIYLRLSKEDGDKEESDSISNQRALILDFLKSMPDIRVHQIRIDDGYSGVDFNRPAFVEMMEDIKSGIVNCVVVKDFSRFGRNYIESGKYIQILFPRAGVRFIAVTDNYDSAKTQGFAGNIIVPFKNMVNDAYCADISGKVRSHLEIKRKKGDFVGAFAVYGYRKDESNHNHMVIDDFAADVVRDIFRWKIEGMSASSIADTLNRNGILSPMEYKRFIGLRFSTSFKINASAKWQANAVARILCNPVYIGMLEQGKRVTPNYKVRKRVDVPQEKWIRVEGVHDPIIDPVDFETVQELLKQDTRAVAKSTKVRPLSGVIVCGDCGAAMVHKINTKNGKQYGYYVCSKHRAEKAVCSTHMISAESCERAALSALRIQITDILNFEELLKKADNIPYSRNNVRKLTARLEAKQEEIGRYNNFRLSLYESYKDAVISREDFISFKSSYDLKMAEAENAAALLKEEIKSVIAGEADKHEWTKKFKEHAGLDILERVVVAELIERVSIYENSRLEITFRYQDKFERLSDSVREVS